ncbi:hypothetical protein SDC9_156892 [bioreactor metagenome]|uniref:Uncharacterized protein n=1 Tax=bioreactor metagenome TaxID=1076179 RepID=A0A645F5R1_9ZZZZ
MNFSQRAHCTDMVGMIMGNKNPPYMFKIETYRSEILTNGSYSYSCVNQNSVGSITNKITITTTSTGKTLKTQFIHIKIL